jgi:hypothetical protein
MYICVDFKYNLLYFIVIFLSIQLQKWTKKDNSNFPKTW